MVQLALLCHKFSPWHLNNGEIIEFTTDMQSLCAWQSTAGQKLIECFVSPLWMMHSCCLETDLVAPRSGGHVLDPHRSVVSDAGMEILFPCRDGMVIGSSVSCCSWPWQTALDSTLNSYSGEVAQICSCFEKPPYSQARETPALMFTDKSWKKTLPFFSGEHSCVSWKRKGKSTPTRSNSRRYLLSNTQEPQSFPMNGLFLNVWRLPNIKYNERSGKQEMKKA